MADITFSTEDDSETIVFAAATPRGEEWMESKEIQILAADALDFKARAEKAGLVVVAFP